MPDTGGSAGLVTGRKTVWLVSVTTPLRDRSKKPSSGTAMGPRSASESGAAEAGHRRRACSWGAARAMTCREKTGHAAEENPEAEARVRRRWVTSSEATRKTAKRLERGASARRGA